MIGCFPERWSRQKGEKESAESGAHQIGIADFGERRAGLAERPFVQRARLVSGKSGFAEWNTVEEEEKKRFAMDETHANAVNSKRASREPFWMRRVSVEVRNSASS